MAPTPAKKTRAYDVASLLDAYFMATQEGMTVNAAARECGVPRSTLNDRVAGRVDIEVLSPRLQPTFSWEEEHKLALHLKKMAGLGYGNSKPETKETATEYAVYLNKQRRMGIPGWAATQLSESWYRGFMARNKETVKVRNICN